MFPWRVIVAVDGWRDPFSSGKVATVRAAAAGAPNENSPHVASLGRRTDADGGYRIRSLSQNEMTKFSPPVRNLDLQAVCLFKDFHQSNGRSERRRRRGERLLIPNNPHVDGVLWFVWSPDYSVSSLSPSSCVKRDIRSLAPREIDPEM